MNLEDIPVYVGKSWMGENDYNPQAGKLNTRGISQIDYRQRGIGQRQQTFEDYLRGAVAGNAPSVAQQQLAIGQQQAIQAAASRAASSRGGNVALGNRMVAQQQAQALQQGNQAAAQLRAQEQMSREQMLMQQMQEQRMAELQSQGLSLEQAKAQLAAETAAMQAKVQVTEGEAERRQKGALGVVASLSSLFASDARAKEDMVRVPTYGGSSLSNALSRLGGLSLQQAQADLGGGSSLSDTLARLGGLSLPDLGAETAATQGRTSANGGAPARQKPTLAASLASLFSDFRSKEGMVPIPMYESRRDLGPVMPTLYRYRPEAAMRMALEQSATPQEQAMVYADKRMPRMGIVAQDLERSPAFAPSVVDTPAGLAIDRDRALSESLAQLGGLDKRLRRLEGGRAQR